MPKYFFNVYRSREPPRIDKEGQRFADDQSACREATKVAAEHVTDLKDRFQIGEEWRLEVTSDSHPLQFETHGLGVGNRERSFAIEPCDAPM